MVVAGSSVVEIVWLQCVVGSEIGRGSRVGEVALRDDVRERRGGKWVGSGVEELGGGRTRAASARATLQNGQATRLVLARVAVGALVVRRSVLHF